MQVLTEREPHSEKLERQTILNSMLLTYLNRGPEARRILELKTTYHIARQWAQMENSQGQLVSVITWHLMFLFDYTCKIAWPFNTAQIAAKVNLNFHCLHDTSSNWVHAQIFAYKLEEHMWNEDASAHSTQLGQQQVLKQSLIALCILSMAVTEKAQSSFTKSKITTLLSCLINNTHPKVVLKAARFADLHTTYCFH